MAVNGNVCPQAMNMEKSMIYPPIFVMFSKAFKMLKSTISNEN